MRNVDIAGFSSEALHASNMKLMQFLFITCFAIVSLFGEMVGTCFHCEHLLADQIWNRRRVDLDKLQKNNISFGTCVSAAAAAIRRE